MKRNKKKERVGVSRQLPVFQKQIPLTLFVKQSETPLTNY